MACELLIGGRRVQCGAVEGQVIPSHHERERYCYADSAAACPTLRLFHVQRARVPQAQYWALWMPEPCSVRAHDAARACAQAEHALREVHVATVAAAAALLTVG
jgi:hypothetical protein